MRERAIAWGTTPGVIATEIAGNVVMAEINGWLYSQTHAVLSLGTAAFSLGVAAWMGRLLWSTLRRRRAVPRAAATAGEWLRLEVGALEPGEVLDVRVRLLPDTTPLYALLSRSGPSRPAAQGIGCGRCGAVSWSASDVAEGYCPACHEFHEHTRLAWEIAQARS